MEHSDPRIVFGFSRGNSLISACIRWFTDSEWSHCWLEFDCDELGGRWIAHATDQGVIIEPAEPKLAYWGAHVRRYEITAPGVERGIREAASCIGKRYDWMAILGHAARLVAYKLTGKRYGNPARNAARLTCSEYLATIAKRAGMDGTEDWDPESIAPSDIEEYANVSSLCTEL